MSEAVRVVVRCRPLNKREKNLKCDQAIEVDENRNQIILKTDDAKNSKGTPKSFTFDGAYFWVG